MGSSIGLADDHVLPKRAGADLGAFKEALDIGDGEVTIGSEVGKLALPLLGATWSIERATGPMDGEGGDGRRGN